MHSEVFPWQHSGNTKQQLLPEWTAFFTVLEKPQQRCVTETAAPWTEDYCPLAAPFLTCLVLGLHCTFPEGRPVMSSNTPSAG